MKRVSLAPVVFYYVKRATSWTVRSKVTDSISPKTDLFIPVVKAQIESGRQRAIREQRR